MTPEQRKLVDDFYARLEKHGLQWGLDMVELYMTEITNYNFNRDLKEPPND